MSDVIGLSLQEDRISAVAVRRRFGQTHVLGAFSVPVGEDVGATLRAKLRETGVRARRVHVGIPRRRVVVKAIELPPVAGADLRRMVGFELERHLPFPPADAVFDFEVLEQAPGQPVRVLLVAVERRVFERISQLVRDAGLIPRLIDVAIHSLAVLAAPGGRQGPGDGRVVLQVEDGEAELAVVRHGRPILSRAFPLPANGKERGQALADELRRSLGPLRPADRDALADVLVTGAPGVPTGEWAGLPVHAEIPLPAGLHGAPDEPELLPALAVALRRPGHGSLRTTLMPTELRPRPFPWPVTVTAGLAALALLLALAVPALTMIRDERRLRTLDRAVADLAPRVREVEQVVAAVDRARKEIETLRNFEAQHVRVLPVMRELTELLPQDVWLTNLSIDRKGLELAGFANSASQLIPILEGSPLLDRAEFTSPVTKGRDKEQFRLKTGWEQLPAATPPAPPQAPAPGAVQPRPGPGRPPAAPPRAVPAPGRPAPAAIPPTPTGS